MQRYQSTTVMIDISFAKPCTVSSQDCLAIRVRLGLRQLLQSLQEVSELHSGNCNTLQPSNRCNVNPESSVIGSVSRVAIDLLLNPLYSRLIS